MRCGASGILHDFSIYVGSEKTCSSYNLGFSGDIVAELCLGLPTDKGFRLFTDNWFTSIKLFNFLKNQGVWGTGVIRPDRTNKCPLMEEKDLKQLGRGSHDSAVDVKNNLMVIRWYDNKQITMLTTIDNIQPVDICNRWSKKDRERVEVNRPAIVRSYNESMGGVDLFGMLISLYRINIRSKRGYMRIVHWCFNVAVVNGWLMYRRFMSQIGQEEKYTLVNFQIYIAKVLCSKGTSMQKRPGRPKLDTPPETPKRGPKRLLPLTETQYDGMCHWPMPVTNKLRCAHCLKGQSRITCGKCNVHLCLSNVKNCFYNFHNSV